jgi:diguanylate cyclase (GGDEF)-like protein
MGRDEFTIILMKVNEIENVKGICERIIEEVARPISLGDVIRNVTASIGVSLFPLDGNTPDELISKADGAMYHAKKSGKNNYIMPSAIV